MPGLARTDITTRYDASVLFSIKTGSLKLAVEAAVKSGANLRDANLREVDLYGADLRDANLRDADLSGANLRDANLRDANLRNADLRNADLFNANLYGADLRDSDLRNADLRDANLFNANLFNANLRGADLFNAGFSSLAVIDGGYPDGFKAFAWWEKVELRVSVGCHTKTIKEARDYWQGKDNRREIMAFLDYAEAVAKVRQPILSCLPGGA